MAIELVEKYLPYVDEQFTEESKKEYLTNTDFSFSGAKTVKVYKISTGSMQDYGRIQKGNNTQLASRYGTIEELNAVTQTMTLSKDYVLGKMCAGAGIKPEALGAEENIYDAIFEDGAALDEADVPETGRILVVTPATLLRMKTCKDNNGRYQEMINAVLDEDKKKIGFVGNIDGMDVLKVSAKRLPEKFGFMIAHPCATVAPVKLESYKTHQDPPGISGSLVEGRIVYDAFVLDNKKKAICYREFATV